MEIEMHTIARRTFLLAGACALAGLSPWHARAETSGRRFRFMVWNDVHVRDPLVSGRPPGYPRANDKAAWLVSCAQGSGKMEAPDFVLSAGDIVDGEISDMSRDFQWLRENVLACLSVPFLPCVGNHENGQGEGQSETYQAYDLCFGNGWRNYVFTVGGIGFIVVDTSGGHRSPDSVTAARNAFVERAFERLGGMPAVLVSHVPLIAMREEEVLKKSFMWPSWHVVDPRMAEIVESHRDTVAAVLTGHLHLSAAKEVNGILHVTSTGTASYPAAFMTVDGYGNRLEIQMHQAPDDLQDRGADIHGKPLHDVDYVDAEHPAHEAYVGGNAAERAVTVRLEGAKRPADAAPGDLRVYHEAGPGEWQSVAYPAAAAEIRVSGRDAANRSKV